MIFLFFFNLVSRINSNINMSKASVFLIITIDLIFGQAILQSTSKELNSSKLSENAKSKYSNFKNHNEGIKNCWFAQSAF